MPKLVIEPIYYFSGALVLHPTSDISYKTIERGYDPERGEELLEEILKITNELGNSNEQKFSIDDPGDPFSMKVNFERKRSQQRKKKESKTRNEDCDLFPAKKCDFQYSVFSIGTTNKIIGCFATTDDHSFGELSFFREAVEKTMDNCPMFDTLCADGVYAIRVVCALLEASAITLFFMPKSNVTF
jgi:hypothetical protein